MIEPFVEMLAGPTNTLGRTEEAVAVVLADPLRIEELYQCYFQPDEWVRLRTSSSFKRIWRAAPELVAPYLEGFVEDVSKIDQPSVQWTFAQMSLEMAGDLTATQIEVVKVRLSQYLEESDDWIVQNNSIETLATWALDDPKLRKWLVPRLAKFASSHRKSVAKRATKWSEKLLASSSD